MLRKRVSLKSLFSWISNFTFGNVRTALRHFFLAIHLPSYTLFSYLLFLRLPLAGSWIVLNLVLEFPFPRHPFFPPPPLLTCTYDIVNFTSNFHCLLYHSCVQLSLCPTSSSFISLNIPNFFPFCSSSTTPVPVCPVAFILLRCLSLPRFIVFLPWKFLIIHPLSLVKTTTSDNWAIIISISYQLLLDIFRYADFYVFVRNLKVKEA